MRSTQFNIIYFPSFCDYFFPIGVSIVYTYFSILSAHFAISISINRMEMWQNRFRFARVCVFDYFFLFFTLTLRLYWRYMLNVVCVIIWHWNKAPEAENHAIELLRLKKKAEVNWRDIENERANEWERWRMNGRYECVSECLKKKKKRTGEKWQYNNSFNGGMWIYIYGMCLGNQSRFIAIVIYILDGVFVVYILLGIVNAIHIKAYLSNVHILNLRKADVRRRWRRKQHLLSQRRYQDPCMVYWYTAQQQQQ